MRRVLPLMVVLWLVCGCAGARMSAHGLAPTAGNSLPPQKSVAIPTDTGVPTASGAISSKPPKGKNGSAATEGSNEQSNQTAVQLTFMEEAKQRDSWATYAPAIGIFLSLLALAWNINRDRRAKEMDTHIRVNDLYREYLERCMESKASPTVDPAAPRSGASIPQPLTMVEMDENPTKNDLHLLWVVSMLESAFFMYHKQSGRFKERQWEGWYAYMEMWCRQPEFQSKFKKLIKDFDSEFKNEMCKIYEKVKKPESTNQT